MSPFGSTFDSAGLLSCDMAAEVMKNPLRIDAARNAGLTDMRHAPDEAGCVDALIQIECSRYLKKKLILRQSKAFGPIRDSDVKDDLIIAFSSGCDSLAAVAQAQTVDLYELIVDRDQNQIIITCNVACKLLFLFILG